MAFKTSNLTSQISANPAGGADDDPQDARLGDSEKQEDSEHEDEEQPQAKEEGDSGIDANSQVRYPVVNNSWTTVV